MPIHTDTKNALIEGIILLLAAFLWGAGWFWLGWRRELFTGLIVFPTALFLCKALQYRRWIGNLTFFLALSIAAGCLYATQGRRIQLPYYSDLSASLNAQMEAIFILTGGFSAIMMLLVILIALIQLFNELRSTQRGMLTKSGVVFIILKKCFLYILGVVFIVPIGFVLGLFPGILLITGACMFIWEPFRFLFERLWGRGDIVLIMAIVFTILFSLLLLGLSYMRQFNSNIIWQILDYFPKPLIPQLFSINLALVSPLLLYFSRFWYSSPLYIVVGLQYVLFWALMLAASILVHKIMKSMHEASSIEKEKWEFVSAYPRVYCMKHLRKPKKVRSGLFFADVLCPGNSCAQADIVRNVRVVGIIGGRQQDVEIAGGEVHVPLWDEETKTARNADIDALEIRGGEQPFSLTWAINAVIIKLANDASRPRGYVKTIPVYLRGNPPLQIGDRNMLNSNFAGIRECM